MSKAYEAASSDVSLVLRKDLPIASEETDSLQRGLKKLLDTEAGGELAYAQHGARRWSLPPSDGPSHLTRHPTV